MSSSTHLEEYINAEISAFKTANAYESLRKTGLLGDISEEAWAAQLDRAVPDLDRRLRYYAKNFESTVSHRITETGDDLHNGEYSFTFQITGFYTR